MSNSGLQMVSYKQVKHLLCISVTSFATKAFFQLLQRAFIHDIFHEQPGGSPGKCNSGSWLKQLWWMMWLLWMLLYVCGFLVFSPSQSTLIAEETKNLKLFRKRLAALWPQKCGFLKKSGGKEGFQINDKQFGTTLVIFYSRRDWVDTYWVTQYCDKCSTSL